MHGTCNFRHPFDEIGKSILQVHLKKGTDVCLRMYKSPRSHNHQAIKIEFN